MHASVLKAGLVVSGGVVAVGLAIMIRYIRCVLRGPDEVLNQIPRKGHPDAPIVLIDFPHVPGVASSCSPFVSKVETWLRMFDLPYTKRVGDLAAAPLKKLPYIEHGDNKVPDSAFIIKYLTNTYPEKVPKLSGEQQAISTAVTALLETRFAMAMGYFRWVDAEGLKRFAPLVFGPQVHRSLRWAVFLRLGQMKAFNTYKMLGYASFSNEDKCSLLEEDTEALAALLGDKKYLTGSVPCTADASLFGFLDNSLYIGDTPALSDVIRKHPTLVSYTDRIRADLYPDTCATPATTSKSD